MVFELRIENGKWRMDVEILTDFVTVQSCDKQRFGRLRGTTSDNLHLSQQN
jgi:hypothetical protein